jgi:hypothetical protein
MLYLWLAKILFILSWMITIPFMNALYSKTLVNKVVDNYIFDNMKFNFLIMIT